MGGRVTEFRTYLYDIAIQDYALMCWLAGLWLSQYKAKMVDPVPVNEPDNLPGSPHTNPPNVNGRRKKKQEARDRALAAASRSESLKAETNGITHDVCENRSQHPSQP